MSFKVSELLNPAPSSGPSSPTQQDESTHNQQESTNGAIASSSSHSRQLSDPQHASQFPTVDLPSSTDKISATRPLSSSAAHSTQIFPPPSDLNHGRYSNSPPAPLSNYGSAAVPVEPSPPLERASFSPTLEQYHLPHAKELHRRQSIVSARASPPPILAPIQSLTPQAPPTVQEQSLPSEKLKPAILSPTQQANSKMIEDVRSDLTLNESEHKVEPTPPSQVSHPPTDTQPAPTPLDPPAGASQPEIKNEPSAPSLEKVPPAMSEEPTRSLAENPLTIATTPTAADDLPTPKKITSLKREDSASRASSADRSSPIRITPVPIPASATTKKRAAPSSAGKKVEKKGTARKPAMKKRKLNALDTDSVDGTPASSRRSGTPASSRASKTPAPRNRKQSSVSIAGSPVPGMADNEDGDKHKVDDGEADGGEDEDEEYEEGAEVFCICRKPDNHTWMIACDGGCEDWFHGKCVNMKEDDGDLVDKYICPNCEEAGKGHTTWKPMCRLPGCRQPARLNPKNPSKYCSDEHGKEFMRRGIPEGGIFYGEGKNGTNTKKKQKKRKSNFTDNAGNEGDDNSLGDANDQADTSAKKRRKANYTDRFGNGGDDDSYVEDEGDQGAASDEDDEMEDSRGGVLTSGDLKAAVSGVKGADDFRKLGEGVLSPPPTVSPDDIDTVKKFEKDNVAASSVDVKYIPEEEEQLTSLKKKKEDLRLRSEALRDREKFLTLIRQRGKSVLEDLKKQPVEGKGAAIKDICGFDARLSWSDAEFEEWRLSAKGKAALMTGTLEAPSKDLDPEDAVVENDGEKKTDAAKEKEEVGFGVCLKKRCERHKQWVKVQQQDIKFEENELRKEMVRVEAEERGLKERAVLRGLQPPEEIGKSQQLVDGVGVPDGDKMPVEESEAVTVGH